MAEETKEIVSTTFPYENLWAKWSEEQKEARAQEIIALAESWSPLTDLTDPYRSELASGYGGFELRDDAITSKLRGALGEIIAVSEQTNKHYQFKLHLTHIFALVDGWTQDFEW